MAKLVVQIVSDLHAEFIHPRDYVKSRLYSSIVSCPADILIVPGDLGNYKTIRDNLKDLIDSIKESEYPDKPVIYVPGNHEYYGGNKDMLDPKLMELDIPNLHILMERAVSVKGITFLGSTGWWDESGYKITPDCLNGMNDFYRIGDIRRNENGITWGRKAYAFFKNHLEQLKGQKVICVSHNGPSLASIPNRFMGSPLNACFSNDWHHLMKDYRPLIWAHGHTHDSFDYIVNYTRVVCNPFGYFDMETNKQYNPWKIVEVEI